MMTSKSFEGGFGLGADAGEHGKQDAGMGSHFGRSSEHSESLLDDFEKSTTKQQLMTWKSTHRQSSAIALGRSQTIVKAARRKP